jgi:hypothetical protein
MWAMGGTPHVLNVSFTIPLLAFHPTLYGHWHWQDGNYGDIVPHLSNVPIWQRLSLNRMNVSHTEADNRVDRSKSVDRGTDFT